MTDYWIQIPKCLFDAGIRLGFGGMTRTLTGRSAGKNVDENSNTDSQ
jgi:hypothetical protein